MDKKIVVPDGMLEAVAERWPMRCMEDKAHVMATLEDALRWLSENPIVPTPTIARELIGPMVVLNETSLIFAIEAWGHRMFFAYEPQVPEEIRDLLTELSPTGEHADPWKRPPVDVTNERILEAYRRGLSARDANGQS